MTILRVSVGDLNAHWVMIGEWVSAKERVLTTQPQGKDGLWVLNDRHDELVSRGYVVSRTFRQSTE